MDIRIECRGAGVVPVSELKDFQGPLKDITSENLDKLKKSIVKFGFSAPVFVWDNDGVNNILDGHQRLKAVISLQADGYHVPDLPVVYIDASSEEEAKKKLLHISSQYGDFTQQGFQHFTMDIDGDFSSLRLTDGEFWLGNTPDFEPATEDEQGKLDELSPKMVTCPHCGTEFDSREQE